MKKVLLILISTSLLIFSGCKNFMAGSETKNELETAIAYANAASYTVRVQAVEGTGTITAGSGDNTMKVTDSLKIGFSVSESYKFIKWHAYLKSDKTVSGQDYVTFDDSTALETTAKLIKAADDLVIEPLCEKTLFLTNAYPEKSSDGVPKDSSIKLTFSSPLSAENDLSKITLTSADTDVKPYFLDPVISGNELLIMANPEKRLTVADNETKNITITIPSDFTYVTDSGNLEIQKEISYSYIINSSTSEKTHITYGTNIENAGTMKVNGIAAPSVSQQYSIGQNITVTFKVSEGYKFTGWNCINTDGSESDALIISPEGENADENGFNSSTSTATVSLTVFKGSQTVTLIAVTQKIPTADIFITTSYGKISPNGTSSYIQGKGGQLIFNADSDYQFIKWQVLDSTNGTDLTDAEPAYISFTNPQEFTTDFILENAPAADSKISLTIQPLCEVRPQIISTTPLYSASGVYRDTRIMITFNQEMSKESIYYTEKEVEKLTADGNTMLETAAGSGIYYGYTDSEGEIYFKNIKIKNFQTKENILKNYGVPYFDTPQILYIPTMPNVLGKDADNHTIVLVDNAPAAGCQPYVEISKNVFYNDDDGNEIYLGSNKVWNYRVNSKIDNESPEFVSSTLKVSASEGFDAENVELSASSSSPGEQSDVKTAYKAAYLKDKKLKVFAEFTDQGSGPAGYVRVCYEKILDSYYKDITDSTKETGYEKLEPVIDGTTAYVGTINGTLNIPETVDFSERSDGLYKVWLECEDVNGYRGYSYTHENAADTYYYVLIDDENSAPYKITKINGNRGSAEQEDLTWSYEQSQTPDFDHCEINCYVNESTDVSSTQSSTAASASITGLTNQTKYSYKICAYDIFGHKTEYTSYVDNTAPYNIKTFTGVRGSASTETLNWTYSGTQPSDFARIIIGRYEGNTWKTDSVVDGNDITSASTTSYSFTGLTNQTKYTYYAYAVDYAGNKTATVSYTDNTAPYNIKTFTGVRGSASTETLNWTYNGTQPADFAYIKIERYNASGTYIDCEQVTAGTTLKYDYSGLTDQIKYSYKVYAKDYAGNTTNSLTYVDNSKPNDISTFTGVRYSAGTETLNWTYTGTQPSDFAYMVIERYDYTGKTLLDTQKVTAAATLKYDYSGLTDQIKYYYQVYAKDYAGNTTNSMTYVDNTPPSMTVHTSGTKSKHTVKVAQPGDSDWKQTIIKKGSSTLNTYSSSSVKGTTTTETVSVSSGDSYTYTVTAYDYAGNTTTVTLTEKCGPGSIYYSDGTASANYYSDRTPIGVVAYIGSGEVTYTNDGASRIWGLDEISGYCWGKYDAYVDASSGKNGYYNYSKMYNNGNVIGSKWGSSKYNGDCYSFTQYLVDTRNVDTTLTAGGTAIWYAPACAELETYLVPNQSSVKAGFTLLKNNNVNCTFDDGHYIWSSTKWDNKYAFMQQPASGNFEQSACDYQKDRHTPGDGTSCHKAYCHFMAQVNLD